MLRYLYVQKRKKMLNNIKVILEVIIDVVKIFSSGQISEHHIAENLDFKA